MIINKNSFSYRWMKFFDVTIPHSLCPYVRKFLFSIAAFFGVIFGALGVCTLFGFAILAEKGAIVTAMLLLKSLGLGVVIVASILAAATGIGYVCVKVSERRKDKRDEYEAKIKSGEIKKPEPGIIKSYYKAVHDKICPTIEFK